MLVDLMRRCSEPWHFGGHLESASTGYCGARFADCRGSTSLRDSARVIVVHHPPFSVRRPQLRLPPRVSPSQRAAGRGGRAARLTAFPAERRSDCDVPELGHSDDGELAAENAALAHDAAGIDVDWGVQRLDVHGRFPSLSISHATVTATASSSRCRVSNP